MHTHIQLDKSGQFLRYIPAATPVEWDSNNFCTVSALEADGKSEQFRVFPLTLTPEPAYDRITEGLRKVDPKLIDGAWTLQYEIYPLSQSEIEANLSAKETIDKEIIKNKIDSLWEAADKYTSSYISGVAIGILTIGVVQQRPKAIAISAWVSSIWAEYYNRKQLVSVDSLDNHDFGMFGPMPYSVPELQAEVSF